MHINKEGKIVPNITVPFTFYEVEKRYVTGKDYIPEKIVSKWSGETELLGNFTLTDNINHQLFFLQINCSKYIDEKFNKLYVFRINRQDLLPIARPDLRATSKAINRFLESEDGKLVKEVAIKDYLQYSDDRLIYRTVEIIFLKERNVDIEKLLYRDSKYVAASFIIHLNHNLGEELELGFEVSDSAIPIMKQKPMVMVEKEPEPERENTDTKSYQISVLKSLRKNIKFFDRLTTKAEYFGSRKDFEKLLKRFVKNDRDYFNISGVNTLLPQAIYELHKSINVNLKTLQEMDVFDGEVEKDPKDRGLDAYRIWAIFQWIWCVQFLVEDYLQGKNHSIKTFRKKVSSKMPITAYAIASLDAKLSSLKENNESVCRKTES